MEIAIGALIALVCILFGFAMGRVGHSEKKVENVYTGIDQPFGEAHFTQDAFKAHPYDKPKIHTNEG